MYVYSATTNAFYPTVLKDSYEAAGSWPADGVEVTEEVFLEFSQNVEGKYRWPKGNMPSWKEGSLPWEEKDA